MRDDPCFSCVLADCDIKSDRCNVRKLARAYEWKRRRGEIDQITPAERRAQSEVFNEWHRERMAKDAEGIKPFPRRHRYGTEGAKA